MQENLNNENEQEVDKIVESESNTIYLTDDNIENFIKNGPSVILFAMPNSNPSILQEEALKSALDDFNKDVFFGIVDVFEHQEYAIKSGLKSFPSTIYIKDNEVIDLKLGLQKDIGNSLEMIF